MLSFKSFLKLNEELTLQQQKQVSTWKRDPKAIAHTDHFFGKGNDDKTEPLQGGVQKSEPHVAIERHLGHEISHDEYKAGKTKDKYGREVKIGALLQKTKADPKLVNQFANDSTRQLKAQSKLSVHVTRSAAGVAGQTSGTQSWREQSCKNYEDGSNRHFLKHEVKHGTVVAYLKNEHGHELARQTFQPYHSDDGKVVYRRNGYYGPKHAEFESHCNDVEKRLSAGVNPDSKGYRIHPDVYDNDGISTILHPKATAEHITQALKHKDADVRDAAIRHPNATAEHITQALNDKDADVRAAAIKHSKATAEHITQALKDDFATVRRTAIEHPNATAEHITQALNDKTYSVRAAAIKHPKATAEHITQALKHKDADVRAAAIRHPKATHEHITQALNDKNYSVRAAAIRHPNATADHITQALKHKDVNVRAAAIKHPNATAEHITQALNDNFATVRRTASNIAAERGVIKK